MLTDSNVIYSVLLLAKFTLYTNCTNWETNVNVESNSSRPLFFPDFILTHGSPFRWRKCLFHHHNWDRNLFGLLVYVVPSTPGFFFTSRSQCAVYGWHFDNFPIRYACFTVPSDMFSPLFAYFYGKPVTGSFSCFSSLRMNSSPYVPTPTTFAVLPAVAINASAPRLMLMEMMCNCYTHESEMSCWKKTCVNRADNKFHPLWSVNGRITFITINGPATVQFLIHWGN